MKELNAELAAQVRDLARLIGRKLNHENFDLPEQAKPLIQTIVRGGYARMSDVNLQVRLEAQVLKDFAEIAIHRHRETSAMAGEMQETFDELVMWHTNQPTNQNPSVEANRKSKNG
ncbi:MAG: hypothetical protein ABI557_08970 [Aureliella sp.]